MVTAICKKGTQAINYFARKKDGKINKMKAVKLIYLADRYHLRKYGRPIVGDNYWAMKLGPVGSDILNIANISENNLNAECLSYVKKYISHSHPDGDERAQNVISKSDVDLDVFSQSDIDAFETIFKEFGGRDQFELAEITHKYPEWSKFEKDIIVDRKKRVRMHYEDFFSNPRSKVADVFDLSPEHLDIAKEIYQENRETQNALS
jgi:uncharacterized phage-associated protein